MEVEKKPSLAEKLRDFLDTDEGKKSLEEFGKKLERDSEFKNRWAERFKKYSEGNIDLVLEKLILKYNSSEYVEREHSLGYEPRETLLWVAFNYAKKYCTECKDQKYLNMFTGEAYYIGSYVIQVMNGQGSVISLDKMESIENIDWSKSHCGVILCDYERTNELMPEVIPVIRDLIETGELEFPISEYLIDVKVHMLMADQFPCIPDWHCDFVPRNNETKLKEPERITGEKMYLWVSGEPKTEFRDPPRVIKGKNTQWVEFTQNDYHRGVKATKRTWRCFIRLVPKCLVSGRPTGNKDTSHRGDIRRHSQVYLDANSFEW